MNNYFKLIETDALDTLLLKGTFPFSKYLFWDTEVEKNLSLLTIRHYDAATIERLTKDKVIVLEQKTPVTVQMLMR